MKAKSTMPAKPISSTFVADNWVFVNIGGKRRRLVDHVSYGIGIVYVKFIGTHSEHGNFDPQTV